MATDNDSVLSDPLTTVSNLFTLAKSVKSAATTVPIAQRTRGIEHRRPVANAMKSSQQPTQQLNTIAPTGLEDEEEEEEDHEQEEKLDGDEPQGGLLGLHLRTPGPGSGVSQSSDGGSKDRARPKTSWIHDHVRSIRRNGTAMYGCNYCSMVYNPSGGTGAFQRHLKSKHQIDPSASSVAQKRDKNGTAVDAAILRHAELNQELNQEREEKTREELLALNKTTLEYLYIRWTTTHNIAFNQVSHVEFRDWLEYVNPVANKLLPSSHETIRKQTFALMQEGKARLRHILAAACSDIHITCDMWTSPNQLGVLAVVAHFTSEKLTLTTATLALIEIDGEHSGLNQALAVLRVIDDFQIRGKLGYFVMDNATTNDVLIERVAESLQESNIAYDGDTHRLRCNGHIINLVVQAFLFGKEVDDYEAEDETPSDEDLDRWRRYGPLGKLHNIVVWVMASP